jgi:hypothetical protein
MVGVTALLDHRAASGVIPGMLRLAAVIGFLQEGSRRPV